MNIFDGITSVDWGFNAADLWENGMFIVSSVAGFIILGLVIYMVPSILWVMRQAALHNSRDESKSNGFYYRELKQRLRNGGDW